MKLKIMGRTPERVKKHLAAVLNIATVVVQSGHIPTAAEQAEPDRTGRYWFVDQSGTRYHLAGAANDYWANVRESTDGYVVIEFSCRYDKGNHKQQALTQLMPAFFVSDVAQLVQ